MTSVPAISTEIPTTGDVAWLCGLLQAGDSFYPTGSYAHSFGLEGLVQEGVVRDRETLRQFLFLSAVPALRQTELPIAAHAWHEFGAPDWAAIGELCVLSSALKAPRESRLAAENIGRQRAELVARLRGAPLGVETGGCPHTAIRDDTTMNEQACRALEARLPGLQLVLVESGGDNLTATFFPKLVDAFIYVIDVAEGDKIPRKGGPAIRFSDLLIINKIDLAPLVGADLGVMDRDAKIQRGARPFLFCDLKREHNLDAVVAWVDRQVLLADIRAAKT